MRSDQRALRLEVKKQIIKYLDSDLFLFVLIWPRMECIKQTLAGKSPEPVKAMDHVHYMSGFYSRTRKHYVSYHKIRSFPDVTSLSVKKYVE